MKRKISIITLALFFFTANTALPFTLHICQMIGMKDACTHLLPKKVSCCEDESRGETYLAKSYDQCCLLKIVDPSLKENYLSAKTEVSKKAESLILHESITTSLINTSLKSIYSDISPPPKTENIIYLLNSSLLI